MDKSQSLLKTILPHLVAVIVFLGITLTYFSPLMEGKMLPQGDVKQYQGASQELREYYNKEKGSSAWTGSMFSGMPAYQIGIWGGSPNFLDYLEVPLKALGSNSAGPVFAAMLMAYILFCIMGFKPIESAIGAIAYSLSSYNIIIIEAGHVTKAWALAYMPLIIASMIALYRRKLLLSGLLMALGLALQLKSNHLQITYYTALFCLFLYIGFVIDTFRKKEVKILLKGSGIIGLALIIAVSCNMGNLYSNLEMAKESTRGKSELSVQSTTEKQSAGLDKNYTFAWSYGKAETFSFLIPDIHGGISRPFDDNSDSYKALIKLLQSGKISEQDANTLYGSATQYWGDQPFTSGPVYFGVVICFLFVLGMIIIRSPMKWIFFVSTIFFIFLSWGRNLEFFNDLFFYYFPLYSKFRAVSTALVIPSLTMVIIAVWGLKEFFSGEIAKDKLIKSLYISGGIVGGLCLLLWLVPGTFFNFISQNDVQRGINQIQEYYQIILLQRKDMLSADALRSLVFLLLCFGILFVSLKSKLERSKIALYSLLCILILTLIDLWGIDKRYLNNSNFVSKNSYLTSAFPLSVADKAILADKSPSHRVLNLNNPFNETTTSYYHKSIGGYHAAKLKRYQELIDYYLQDEIMKIGASFSSQNLDSILSSFVSTPVLNMLNAKYIIYHPEQAPLINNQSMGNAWFVDDYRIVDNADQEIKTISEVNLAKIAIVDKRFQNELQSLNIKSDSTSSIVMTEYKPDRVTYKSKSNSEGLAVFSEIYFADGWQAYIDGKQVSHIRADWTLRAMRVPSGEHIIEFKFEPKEYYISRTIATASSAMLILLLIGAVVSNFIRKKEEDK